MIIPALFYRCLCTLAEAFPEYLIELKDNGLDGTCQLPSDGVEKFTEILHKYMDVILTKAFPKLPVRDVQTVLDVSIYNARALLIREEMEALRVGIATARSRLIFLETSSAKRLMSQLVGLWRVLQEYERTISESYNKQQGRNVGGSPKKSCCLQFRSVFASRIRWRPKEK